jgi:hypothetical protein
LKDSTAAGKQFHAAYSAGCERRADSGSSVGGYAKVSLKKHSFSAFAALDHAQSHAKLKANMGSPMSGVKRFLFWDYPRAGWQYDVMVGVILAFIFLTPREWFRDQPRASSIVMLPAEHGSNVFWMEPDQLTSIPEAERVAKSRALIKARTGKEYKVIRLEPIVDSEQEVKGYMAYTMP